MKSSAVKALEGFRGGRNSCQTRNSGSEFPFLEVSKLDPDEHLR